MILTGTALETHKRFSEHETIECKYLLFRRYDNLTLWRQIKMIFGGSP